MTVRLVMAAAVVPDDRELDREAGAACGAPCVGGRRVQLVPAVVAGTEAELVEQFRVALRQAVAARNDGYDWVDVVVPLGDVPLNVSVGPPGAA